MSMGVYLHNDGLWDMNKGCDPVGESGDKFLTSSDISSKYTKDLVFT